MWRSHLPTFIIRHPFQTQPDLQLTPIEKLRLPLKSRDELPPILAGLQWLWMHPTLKADFVALLEAKILAGKKATGRTGMDLWPILVLGVVRLGLDADWDRMEYIAHYETLVRQMLGVPAMPWGEEDKMFGHQTLRDNVALLDDQLQRQINARIAAVLTAKQAQEDAKTTLKTATSGLNDAINVRYPEFSCAIDLLRGMVGNKSHLGKQLTNIRKLVTKRSSRSSGTDTDSSKAA